MPHLHAIHCDVNDDASALLFSESDFVLDMEDSKAAIGCGTFMHDPCPRPSPSSSVHSLSWSLVSTHPALDERTPQSATSTWSTLDAFDLAMTPCTRGSDTREVVKADAGLRDHVHDHDEVSVMDDSDDEFEFVPPSHAFQPPHPRSYHFPTITRVIKPTPIPLTLAIPHVSLCDPSPARPARPSESRALTPLQPTAQNKLSDLTLEDRPEGERVAKQGDRHNASLRYETLFDAIQDQGVVDGETVRLVWNRSRLEHGMLGYIWRGCDPEGRGVLDKEAFVRGMREIDSQLLSRTADAHLS